MNHSSSAVKFLYGTRPGRAILSLILRSRADRFLVQFLRSPWSRPLIGWYAKRHGIPLSREQRKAYRTFRDFFAREREELDFDPASHHLISPCDGWLSYYPIHPDSSFSIKGFSYRLEELLQDADLAARYHGGDCLIFRLEASDYHHYCYIDDGFQGNNHFIPGALHSVQPSACAVFPVYTLNRRMWTLLATEHFGPVVQTEVGALVVGGIVAQKKAGRFRKGEEMGRFELCGSTIVLLFERGRIQLLPRFIPYLTGGKEVQVRQGAWIGSSVGRTAYD